MANQNKLLMKMKLCYVHSATLVMVTVIEIVGGVVTISMFHHGT